MIYIKAIILGVIQGVSEFLPISSSGHLNLLSTFLDFELESNKAFDIMLHLATLLVVIIIFREDLIKIIKSLYEVIIKKRCKGILSEYKENKDFRTIIFIIIGTIPIVIIGFLFKDIVSEYPSHLVSVNLIITGLVLLLPKIIGHKDKDVLSFGIKFAIIIGIAQSIAILPGISRSGSTISTSLILGASPQFAGVFSFLLSIPAILGAGLLYLKDIGDINIAILFLGFISAFISGYISLKMLLIFLKRGKLYYFSFYCIAFGAISFVYLLLNKG